jgi:uncharacterized delta-60 repeat protein
MHTSSLLIPHRPARRTARWLGRLLLLLALLGGAPAASYAQMYISNISPNPAAVGSTITITGSGFAGGLEVQFEGYVDASVYSSDNYSFQVTVPAGAESGYVNVFNWDTYESTSSYLTISSGPAPLTVSSFSPDAATVGSTITLNGTGFAGAMDVEFTGSASVRVTASNPTALSVVVPPGAQTGPIRVVRTNDGAAQTSASLFTVLNLCAGAAVAVTPAGPLVLASGGSHTLTAQATLPLFGIGFNNDVRAVVQQADGKLLVSGYFTSYNGTAEKYVVRLQADGTRDNTFAPTGSGLNDGARTMALLPNGQVLVGGDFTTYNGVSQNRLVRLNADGTLDNTFAVGTGFDGDVVCLALLPNGQVLVGGRFTTYNGAARNRMVRLNTDGTLDNTFAVGTGFDASVTCLGLQPDGKALVGGFFYSYNNVPHEDIVRLNADGTLDTGFAVGSSFNNGAYSLALLPNGQVLVGGGFTTYNGVTQNRLVRLNTNGTLDNTFAVGTGFDSSVLALALQPDGKILAAGNFTSYQDDAAAPDGLLRLTATGALDQGFNYGGRGLKEASNYCLLVQADGKIVVGGTTTAYNTSVVGKMVRVNTNGTPDTTPMPTPASYTWSPGGQTTASITVSQPGTYAVSATTAGSCPVQSNSVVLTLPTPTISSLTVLSGSVGTSLNITGTNLTGATAVAFNGTTATYTVNSATEITATVPAGATSGTVSVTTPGGTANSTDSFTVTVPLALAGSSTNLSCASQPNGTATVTASGGTAPYTYSWNTSPVQTTATATGLAPGNYTVTVTDAASAQATRSFIITSNDATAPVTLAQDVTLTLDASGAASLAATAVDNGSTDNCGIATRTLSRTSFTCADVNPATQPAVRRGNVQFTGANKQYVLSNTAISGTTTGTLETWVKTTTNNAAFSALIASSTAAGDGGSDSFLTLRWDGNGRVACEGLWVVNQTGAALSDGQWHHVAAVADGSTCKLYIDGVLNSTGGVATGQVFTNRRIVLGVERSRTAVAGYFTTMELDNSRVWNVARTASQIVDGMSNEVPANAVGLQLAYAFNEVAGSSTARDASGNNRTATLYGTTLPTFTAAGGALLVPRGTPVTLTVADASGNTSTATAYATVQTGLPATALTLSSTTVPENVPVGTVVATLGLTNPGPCTSTTSTFALVNAAGTDYTLFSLGTGSNANQLLINTVPDYETRTSYTVRLSATDQNNVTVDRTVTITVADRIELSGTQTTACGSTGATATVTIAGTATGYTYSWSTSPVQTTATATGLPTGTYTVTVSKAGLPDATRSFTITGDVIAPVAMAQDVTVTLDASTRATLAASAVENGSTDNCGVATRSLSRTSFSCADLTPAAAVRRGSLQFSGPSKQYVLSNAAISGTATGTLETWVKTSTVNGSYGGLIASSTAGPDGGSGDFLVLRWDNGRVLCEGIWNVNQTGAVLSDGQWHHVAAVGDGSTCKLYLDGVLNATGTVNASQTFNRRILLGAERSRTASLTSPTMELDNSRVWNVARTAAQVLDGMTNEVPANTVGLQLAYAFNEGAGSTARDASGNNRPATLYGTTLPTFTAAGGALLVPPGVPITLTVADATGNTGTATAYVNVQPYNPGTTARTWTGTASTDWNDCGNWQYGLVPTAGTTSISIPAGRPNYPALTGTSLTVADLNIAAGASLNLGTTDLLVTDNLDNQGPTLAGSVSLTGTSAQTVAGSFGTLVVNKPSGSASLSGNASTNITLTMTSGVLTTGSYVFTLIGNTANGITETATSYVSGTVQTTRNLITRGTSYGLGGMGLTLTPGATGNLPGSTLVTRTTGTARTGINGRQGILRSFDIQPTVNTGLNVTLVFSYRDSELNGIAEASLALFKSETGATDTWGRQRYVTLNATANTATLAGVQSFSIWTLGNANAPLPVELAAFTAQAEGPAARLQWTTASEKNNAYFDVERSLNGREFSKIGQEQGQGSKATATSYTFLDKQLPAGTSYYRLRQVDLDGTTSYSPVRTVMMTAPALAASFIIYPTEALPGQALRYAYTGPALPANATLEVYDATGRCVHRQVAGAAAGLLEVKGLNSGWYWVRLQSATGPQQARFYQP